MWVHESAGGLAVPNLKSRSRKMHGRPTKTKRASLHCMSSVPESLLVSARVMVDDDIKLSRRTGLLGKNTRLPSSLMTSSGQELLVLLPILSIFPSKNYYELHQEPLTRPM
jgi:hypothetical protein